jgi:glycosyltransferase involved in cell wall biosynthesis
MLCGDGQCRRELEALVMRLGVEKQCRFLGFRRDLGEIFRAMDLMVLPSLTEGLPNVVLEAFAEAKPVVATSVGGVPEIVEDGVSGLLVPPGDSGALADATIRLLLAPDAGKAMGMAGHARLKKDFTFEAQNALLEGIYGEVLSGAGR